ncbi:MAG: hypothetical protein NTU47_04720 [Ignavibacteriales bacterium]|nr:hypothetical protein [Ignavibacteriales bacterium]
MKIILNVTAAVGLILTFVPSVLVAMGRLEWQTHANLMTAGMIVWFIAATWQSRKQM